MRPYRLAAALAAAAAFVTPLPGRAAEPTASCWTLAVSPAFLTDGTAACAGYTGSLLVTTDRGRTWRSRAGARPPSGMWGLVFSPRYAVDHTLYGIGDHLYASTDDGATFVPVDADWAYLGHLVPYVAPAPAGVPAGDRVSFAFAKLDGYLGRATPQVVEPDLHVKRPVEGSGPVTLDFAMSPVLGTDGAAFSFVLRDGTWAVDRCDALLACHEEVASFPKTNYVLSLPEVFWVADDWPAHRDVSVVARGGAGAVALRSTDGGETFGRWRSLERLAVTGRADRGAPDVQVAHDGHLPNRLYALVTRDLKDGAARGTAATLLHRSDDRGRTWRLVATHRIGDPSGPRRGRLPGPLTSYRPRVTLAPDGRLFAVADFGSDDPGVFCSTDGGSTWRHTC